MSLNSGHQQACSSSRWYMSIGEPRWNDTDRGNRRTRRKSCFKTTANPRCTDPGTNPVLICWLVGKRIRVFCAGVQCAVSPYLKHSCAQPPVLSPRAADRPVALLQSAHSERNGMWMIRNFYNRRLNCVSLFGRGVAWQKNFTSASVLFDGLLLGIWWPRGDILKAPASRHGLTPCALLTMWDPVVPMCTTNFNKR
jgi:hypothetical protein